MATVGTRQVTAAFIRPGETAGACSFCDWAGPWRQQDQDGVNLSAAEAREHLGQRHPEAVTHWEDLL